MQIVIEIPEEMRIEITRVGLLRLSAEQINLVGEVIQNGTPLDDIKAEIEEVVCEEADDARWARGLHYSLKIIDKHTEEMRKLTNEEMLRNGTGWFVEKR